MDGFRCGGEKGIQFPVDITPVSIGDETSPLSGLQEIENNA